MSSKIHLIGMSGCKQRWRKLLLVSMCLLQMLVIGGFWLLQVSSYNAELNDNTQDIILPAQDSVLFIKKSKIKNNSQKELLKITANNVNSFELDFKQLASNNSIWCYYGGTEWQLSIVECVCKPHWHGKHCAQPEVVWRALLTARKRFSKFNSEPSTTPLRLIYMIEGHFVNILLLELQIEAVEGLVDYFIINYTNRNAKLYELETFEKKLRKIFNKKQTNYTLLICNIQNIACSRKLQLKSSDICVHSNDHTILGIDALKYIKYYANKEYMPNWHFRLKHNVYGFYWQHIQQTQVQSFLGSCSALNMLNTMKNDEQSLTIGDLNHFGGWFCELCDQPNEIIAELLLQPSNSTQTIASNLWQNSKTGQINAEHLQQLISQGIYIDGKTQLNKVRRYSDTYYAPDIALNNTYGKYSYLLLNMYESLDDDLLDDNYAK